MAPVKIAVEGCCHGCLNNIYKLVKKDTELLIICGDFQAIRNKLDLRTIKVPPKYLQAGDFPEYYMGRKTAPVLTVFIGGNHESLLYMHELQFGGWVAPNIYYLGEFGSVWYKGIRITGLSGIYNSFSFAKALEGKGPTYKLPYDRLSIASIYHIKPKAYLKLLLSGESDIVLSHDWPQKVWDFGDRAQLLRHKPFFREDMQLGKLGSPLARNALAYLRPRFWFSLHLHTRFDARVKHKYKAKRVKTELKSEAAKVHLNPDEIELDMDGFDDSDDGKKIIGEDPVEPLADVASAVAATTSNGIVAEENMTPNQKRVLEDEEVGCDDRGTYFLALDKCLPGKRFIEHLTVQSTSKHPSVDKSSLFYDARTFAVHRVVEKFASSLLFSTLQMNQLLNLEKMTDLLQELTEEVDLLERGFEAVEIPQNFEIVAPTMDNLPGELKYWPNKQTQELCERIGIPEPSLS